MIPTTVSSSPSTATGSSNSSGSCVGSIATATATAVAVAAAAAAAATASALGNSNTNNNNSNTNNNNSNNSTNNNGQQNSSSIMVGLASLILEGRAIADDEFQPQPLRSSALSDVGALSGSGYNWSNVGSESSVGLGGGSGVGGLSGALIDSSAILGNRLPPDCAGPGTPVARPSTSRAAATVGGRLINITTNPYAFGCGAMSAAYDRAPSPLYIDPYSSSSASSSAESTHQRWTQKLCQLRQASPAASLSSTYEQPVAVEGRHCGDPELVALSINESSGAERGEFEIVRRVLLNHTNVPMAATASSSAGGGAGSASSSPGSGSENLLFSLQSLATTCLRSGGPSLEMRGGGGDSYRYTTLSPPTIVRGPSYGYRVTPPSSHRFPSVPGSGSSSGSGIQSPKPAWTPPMNVVTTSGGHLSAREKFLRQTATTTITATPGTSSGRVAMSSGGAASWLHTGASAAINTAATATTKAATMAAISSTYPQQGPHCDQFLRKMGLAKGEAAEAEEHFCDMSYVNITCSRWRAYCLKMEGIIERGEPVCIEVYLGPVGHKILLEQWIITQKEKLPPPTMTLPSLCSAIRSQLYFSQISAWCDLIKKSDKTIYDTGRIIFPRATGAAGDLATPTAAAGTASGTNVTPGTSPTSALNQQLASAVLNRRPRLNIFYRIKPFDSTACFNSKPNVHNFPNVNISENCSISVCLKSLPRINGGIPKVGTLSTSAPTTTTTTTTTAAGDTAIATMASAATTMASAAMATGAGAATNGAENSSKDVKSEHDGACSNGARMIVAQSSNGSDNSNTNTNSNSDKGNSNGNNSVETPSTSRSVNGSLAATNANANADVDVDAIGASTSATAIAASQANCDMKKGCAFAANTPSPLASNVAAAGTSDLNTCPQPASSAASCSFSAPVGSGDASTATNGDSSNSAAPDASKHKCMFFIDEEELLGDEAAFDEDDNDNPSDTANSTCDSNSNTSTSAFSPSAVLSHREKQLLKYRKRMMKRDKKHQRKLFSNASDASCEMGATKELQRRRQDQRNGREGRNACQPMEQGEEDGVVTTAGRHSALTANSNGSGGHHAHIEMISTGTQTSMTCCQQCGSEKALVCLKCLRGAGGAHSPASPHSQHTAPTDLDVDEMDDSASSISSSDIIHTPRNKAELLLQAIQRTPKAAKHKKQTQRMANTGAGAGGRGSSSAGGSGSGSDSAAASTNKLQNNNHLATSNGSTGATGNGTAADDGAVAMNGSAGCQVCKRQKTQHNFGERDVAANVENANASALEADENDDGDSGKVDDSAPSATNSESMEQQQEQEQQQTQTQPAALPTESQGMDEESYLTSTKLTSHVVSSTSSTSLPYQLMTTNCAAGDCNTNRSCTPPHTIITSTYMDDICCAENSKEAAQFKTPPTSNTNSTSNFSGAGTGGQPSKSQPTAAHIQPSFQHQHNLTPKPNLLQISCNYHGGSGAGDGFAMLHSNGGLPAHSYASSVTSTPSPDQPQSLSQQHQQPHNALLLRKGLPKVNLTPIFCNPAASLTSSHSSPIPMHSAALEATFSFDTSALKRSAPLPIGGAANHHSNNGVASDNNIPVQKSYSAPTLPNSPSLSPRFAKQAAIYKRRSRHLSDRSDRSSLGSDEQFSDEDLENGGMYSPATSPLKQRARIAAAFGRQPLLGNLEESLLQKRLMPKVEVMGFKVLLGASGGFCPTQLTIPAAAYFYELHGETLSTPYVCDIRLPRKGYSVPRVGNVQATLLNPMGTVVRMFVIPYDMHDMPPLHQTFIRQRILAEASSNEATQNGMPMQQGHNSGSGDAFLNGYAHDEATRSGSNNHNSNSNNNNNTTKANYNHNNSNSNNNSNNNNNKYRLSPSGGLHGESNLGHFISAEHMKRLRYSIHLRFQTSRSGRLSLHTDIRLLISRRTDCDTAAAHAKGVLEAPNDLVTDTVMPTNPKYSARPECSSSSGSNKI